MMSSRLLALILEDQQFGTCIELNMSAFISFGKEFFARVFSFYPVMRALYMGTSTCLIVETHLCFVSSLCFSYGRVLVLVFSNILVVRVPMQPANIGCKLTSKQVHLPSCSQMTLGFSIAINGTTLMYFSFKLIQKSFIVYALPIILIILLQLKYLSPREIQRFTPFYSRLIFTKTKNI